MANSVFGKLVGYDCPKCKNRGYFTVAVQNELYPSLWEEVTRECSCMSARRELARIKASGLEKLGSKYTFRKYKAEESWQKELKKKAKEYVAADTDSWLFIGGQPGSGKTHISTAVCMELMKKGRQTRYMVWIDELPKLKSFVNDHSFENLLYPFKSAEILYIDDFLKTKKGESVTVSDVNMAFRIINHRYNAGLRTIISTEYSLAQIINIDEALGSRIAEMTDDKYNVFIAPDPKKNYRYNKFDKGEFVD